MRSVVSRPCVPSDRSPRRRMVGWKTSCTCKGPSDGKVTMCRCPHTPQDQRNVTGQSAVNQSIMRSSESNLAYLVGCYADYGAVYFVELFEVFYPAATDNDIVVRPIVPCPPSEDRSRILAERSPLTNPLDDEDEGKDPCTDGISSLSGHHDGGGAVRIPYRRTTFKYR